MELKPKQRAFLTAFARLGTVRAATQAVKVARRSHYYWLAHPEYAAAFHDAQEEVVDLLAAEARRRAVEYSDTLLMFLLKAEMPEKYRDNWTGGRARGSRAPRMT